MGGGLNKYSAPGKIVINDYLRTLDNHTGVWYLLGMNINELIEQLSEFPGESQVVWLVGHSGKGEPNFTGVEVLGFNGERVILG